MFLFCFLGRFYQAERWSVNIFLIQQCRPLFFLVSFLSLAGTCWPFLILSFYISSLEFVLYVNSLQKATQTHTAGSIQNCGTQCNMGSFSLAVFLSPFPFSTPQALEATLESVSLFELTPFFSFLYLSTVWTILPTLGGRVCFFFFLSFYECQSPRSACEGCQCCGIYRSLSLRLATLWQRKMSVSLWQSRAVACCHWLVI